MMNEAEDVTAVDLWSGEPQCEALSSLMVEKFDQARQHHSRRDYSTALDIYQEILEHYPNNGRVNYHIAVLARHLNQSKVCERYLKRSIDYAETVDQAVRRQLELASLLMLQNRLIEADDLIDRAEPFADGNAEFYELRGKLKHSLERYDDAIAAFENACALKPHCGAYWVQLADSMTRSDSHYHQADAAIRWAAHVNINEPKTLIDISAYYIDQGDYAAAEPYLRMAFRIAEKNGKPLDAFFLSRQCSSQTWRHGWG